jgi:hypothetical protein
VLRRGLAEHPPVDQTVGLHAAQRLGEHLLGDAGQSAAQVRVPLRAVEQ